MRLADLAAQLGRPAEGDWEVVVVGVTSPDEGGPVDLAFMRSPRHDGALRASKTGS